ncbi:uncharacterized protein [Nothobranchius furzeri]|uniref:LOC107382141-like protein n=2 Tax=Nothobranchius furzeri TaxID=105023 RepID=A0A9D3BMJ8_NOTFU|nr:putative LOC107382141-like protein [Nothobranchius furzeri]
MTKASLIKLILLVILAFIICLPEFFRTHSASRVNFLCLTHQLCKIKSNRRPGKAEEMRKDICDGFWSPAPETWEQICTQKNQSNRTDLRMPEAQGTRTDPERSWFLCEADKNMEELYNISASGLDTYFEVSVELQLNDSFILNLNFYGHSNDSSLHLYPTEEHQTGDDEGQREAFYCCPPHVPTAKSANQCLCHLWLANQTVLTGTEEEKLPWKQLDKGEWWCVSRVIWLFLLCVVLLTVFTAVIRQINWRKLLGKKSKVRPISHHSPNQKQNAVEKKSDAETLKEGTRSFHQSYGLQICSKLPPIQEAGSQSEIETLLNENTDQSVTGNLHHRVHIPTFVDVVTKKHLRSSESNFSSTEDK